MLKAQKKLSMNRPPKPDAATDPEADAAEAVDAAYAPPSGRKSPRPRVMRPAEPGAARSSGPAELSPVEKAQVFFLKNRNLLLGTIGALIVLGVAFAAITYFRNQKQAEASLALAKVEPVYSSGDYIRAVQGDTAVKMVGLRAIADQYGSTPSGNMATFYTAKAYQQLDSLDLAMTYFDKVSGDNDYLKAAVAVGRASVLESRKQYEPAAEAYESAAGRISGDLVAPSYYASAARAYALAGKRDKAVELYKKVKDEYPSSRVARDIDRYLAELNELGS